MKVKTIKQYALSEETLEKDIDKFILSAQNGEYNYDYKYGQEGLKLIKAYFRMIEDEFKKQNYTECQKCYKKLMFLLLQSEYNYFDYEDIVGKLNFEKLIKNYFLCLINIFSVEELFNEYVEFLKISEDYEFDSTHKTILSNLNEKQLEQFRELAEKKAETIKKGDYASYDIIYFILELAQLKNDPIQYNLFCKKYTHILSDDEDDEFDAVN
ncbi:MAG: hypothetical protein ABIG84_05155 [archaeon]